MLKWKKKPFGPRNFYASGQRGSQGLSRFSAIATFLLISPPLRDLGCLFGFSAAIIVSLIAAPGPRSGSNGFRFCTRRVGRRQPIRRCSARSAPIYGTLVTSVIAM